MDTLDRYKVLIDKSIPPEYRLALGGIASLVGCASPNSIQEDVPLYRKGEQVCYAIGSGVEPIILEEDILPNQHTVRAVRNNGKKIGASVDYIVNNSYCLK